MSRYYNKDILKKSLEPEQIFDLLDMWGGNPTYQDNIIISDTICHNNPMDGSHKLYYYYSTQLFVCYTSCGTFDIFDLCIKVMKIQKNLEWELYDAMSYIAGYFGFEGEEPLDDKNKQELEDWEIFKRHKIEIPQAIQNPVLKEYNPIILTRFSYPRIDGWEKEGISAEVSRKNFIGYYPGGEQIVIPHFDINGRLIGIRGRSLVEDIAEKYGKYRPLKINGMLYTHPLSMNLYHLNISKDNIKKLKTAVLFESEKSCLMYESYYGRENDISVAACGSTLSIYQVNFLKNLGINELIVAFDRQFKEINDEEFKRLKSKLIHIYQRYKNTIKISFIFDKHMITPYKASPIDISKDIFEQLLKERIIL